MFEKYGKTGFNFLLSTQRRDKNASKQHVLGCLNSRKQPRKVPNVPRESHQNFEFWFFDRFLHDLFRYPRTILEETCGVQSLATGLCEILVN